MDKERAKELAIIHIEKENKECYTNTDYYIGIGEVQDFNDSWYISYTIKYKDFIPEEDQSPVGGAPGFVISKFNEEVRTISWGEYGKLRLTEENKKTKVHYIRKLYNAFLLKLPNFLKIRQKVR